MAVPSAVVFVLTAELNRLKEVVRLKYGYRGDRRSRGPL